MTPEQIACVQVSFGRAADHYDDIVAAFYARLMTDVPEVAHLFPEDMTVQMGKMGATLTAVVANVDDGEWLRDNVVPLGRVHRDIGVEPAMFDPVVGTLAVVIAEGNGTDWDAETAEAWSLTIAALKDLFLEGLTKENQP